MDKQGNVVNYGRTPIVAVGTTDMHAQTQEHQEGPQDKVVQFVSVENWPDDVTVPISMTNTRNSLPSAACL